mgnify:CR=1 FL=1
MGLLDGELAVTEMNRMIHFNPVLGDAAESLDLKPGYDLICSNNTLEHIYPKLMKPILKRFNALVLKGSLMSHFIDLTDHFAHRDSKITIYNFLKFSDAQWALIDNDIQPQNRMRWSEYLSLYQAMGIPCSIEETRAIADPGVNLDFVHEKYLGFNRADLLISHGYIVSHY